MTSFHGNDRILYISGNRSEVKDKVDEVLEDMGVEICYSSDSARAFPFRAKNLKLFVWRISVEPTSISSLNLYKDAIENPTIISTRNVEKN